MFNSWMFNQGPFNGVPVVPSVQYLEMLYVFGSDEKLVATLPKGNLFEAKHKEVLNGENTFEFTVPAGSEYVVEGNLIAFRDLDSYWQVFEIKRIVDVHGDDLTRTAYCEHIFYELLDDIVTDKRPSADATAALAGMLEGTRWQVGIVDDLGASSTSAYYESALSAVQKVANAWKGELNWRCVISGGVITRYVDLLAMRGTDTGKQFAYSKDILSIEREVDTSGVVTALYGRGKGVETESGAYGRRLTFADVEAPGKPLGQEWIGDNDALARWGRPGGRHRFDVFIDEEETDPVKLLEKTKAELDRRKVPRATYRLDVVSLEELTGYEHEKVRLGDLVRVIDREFKPELVVSARVVEIERDLLDPANTKVVLGSFAPSIVDATINTQRRVNDMANRPYNTKWLDGKINVLQNAIENTQSYVFQTGEDGILILDAPTYDQATQAMKLGGGIFAIANQKDGNGGWNWRTFGDGSGFTADLITAGMIDAGLVQIGPQTTFAPGYDPTQITADSVGMGVDSDCTGLWHFDGSLNSHKGVSATFTRASVAYLEDGTEVEAGQPRFETGKFGQAVMVEEGTTNRIINALLVDSNSDGLADNWGQSNTTNRSCLNGVQTFTATARFGAVVQGFNFGSATGPWTFSVEIKGLDGYLVVYLYDANGNYLGGVSSVHVNNDQTFTRVTCATTRTDVRSVQFRIEDNRSSGWTPISFRKPQIEVGKAYATSFIDATRSPERLTIPTAGVIDTQKGTIAMWVKMGIAGDHKTPGKHDNIISLNAGIWGVFKDTNFPANNLDFIVGDSWGSSVTVRCNIVWDKGDWLYIVPKWDLPDISLTVYNFTKGTTATATATGATYTATPTLAHVNCGDGVQFRGYTNSIIDELRIDKIARTDEEIAGWYKANAPFYTSEDMKQWPGYVKVETDGLKVYDSLNNLRVLVGSWLRDAVRKYGIKIIDGEIYSSYIQTGEEGDTTYISLEPPHCLEVMNRGKYQLRITADGGGGKVSFYDDSTDIMYQTGTINAGFSLSGFSSIPDGSYFGVIGDRKPLVLSSSNGKAYCTNSFHVHGNLSCTGTKPAVHETESYGMRALYARESPELKFVDEGVARLTEGQAIIRLDPIFLETIEPNAEETPWLVTLTPYGDTGLYVAEMGLDYIVVRERDGGASNVSFAWSLSGFRKGFADKRMEQFDAIDTEVLESGWEDEILEVVGDDDKEATEKA